MKVRPDFISGADLARKFGVCSRTLYEWVDLGQFPPPWVRIGVSRFWRSEHYEVFRSSGFWPEGAWAASSIQCADAASSIAR